MEVANLASLSHAFLLALPPRPRVALVKVVHPHLLRDARRGLRGDAQEATEDVVEASEVRLRSEADVRASVRVCAQMSLARARERECGRARAAPRQRRLCCAPPAWPCAPPRSGSRRWRLPGL
eukprot:3388948-Pleurochrysis_carterae.AAC.1